MGEILYDIYKKATNGIVQYGGYCIYYFFSKRNE